MATKTAVGGWLRGTTVRKGASSNGHSRAAAGTPVVQSTSTTVFGGGVKDPSGRVSEFSSMDDQCPVCRSDRYLNPKLRLLVSSQCYHKMCESCIDRLFTLGPAPCPICQKTLRKLAFTPQTFEDLQVEKEVAIRRRIAKEFNKRREDFPDLRSYNDYLEEVEDITFNLINSIEVERTEERIAELRRASAALTSANAARELEYAASLQAAEEAEKLARQQRALQAAKEEEDEREERERERRKVIELLERSEMTEDEVKREVDKWRREREKKRQAEAKRTAMQAKNLRERAAKQSLMVADPPHVAIQDDYYAWEDMYTMMDTYRDPAHEAVMMDREGIMRAGGYVIEQAWERAVRSAVAGLDIMPMDEDEDGDQWHGTLGDGVVVEGEGNVVVASS
ncbi:CDK-activating kinase assembly factor [Heliocybe sulcata]|uniref:RNA polymerase II transcription factor B subunit 3 n=1 Tax=Heliocybe sulcata TaxID=5364 RepID=A0A5C3NFK2_9AGAM|nr:CDK-activating kinase assembly factor [Heliocybe sulcata]